MRANKKIDVIHRNTCQIFGVNYYATFFNTRKKEIVQARQTTMELSYKLLKLSLSDVGYYFNKDHATVLHAKKKINNIYDTEIEFRYKYNSLESKCRRMLSIKPKTTKIMSRDEVISELRKTVYMIKNPNLSVNVNALLSLL